MIRPAPPALIAVTALVICASAAAAFADPINLLEPDRTLHARVEVNVAEPPWVAEGCVMMLNPNEPSSPAFAAWFAYVVCLDREEWLEFRGGIFTVLGTDRRINTAASIERLDLTEVPEPATLVLVATGLAAIVRLKRRV